MTVMAEERRNYLRAPMALMAALRTDEIEAPVVLVDLSPTGARIQADTAPDLSREYMLHFSVHRTEYHARFRVVHWTENDGSFRWGGAFLDLSPDERDQLRRTVVAAMGLASTSVRPWRDVLEDAFVARDQQIVIGSTPAGQEIRLSGEDCLEMGEEGIELFVRTVASLESA